MHWTGQTSTQARSLTSMQASVMTAIPDTGHSGTRQRRLATGDPGRPPPRREGVHRARLFPGLAAAGVTLLLAGCGAGKGPTLSSGTSTPETTTTTASPAASVGTVTDPKLGAILVDAQGRT